MAGEWSGAPVAAMLVLVAALYAATDPLRIGPVAKFPDFQAHYVEPADVVEYPRDHRNRLASAERLFVDQIRGPESIAFDSQGRGPYTGISDGRVVRWEGAERGWVEFAVTSSNRSSECDPKTPPVPNLEYEHVCGRPLGLRFKKSTSELYIADAYLGLMVVGPEGGLAKSLVTEAEGEPLVFTNDLDFDEDGSVYFTDSSTEYQRRNFFVSILAGDNTGRLLKYDPSTKKTTVLLRGLRFPNGVSMSKDHSFLVFAESINGKLTRYWLKGPKAGIAEVFAVLPGHPDNVRTNDKGEFWVALHTLRKPMMQFFGARPKLREFLLKLPFPAKLVTSLLSGSPHAMVLKYSADGELLDVLEDQKGEVVSIVSEVEEHDGQLWLGSVIWNHIAVYRL